MNFSATREELPDKIVIRVRGDVDMATATELLAALTPDSGRPFVVDLSEATFMDSQGMNTLVRASKHGAAIVLRSPSPTVRNILALSGLDQAFEVED